MYRFFTIVVLSALFLYASATKTASSVQNKIEPNLGTKDLPSTTERASTRWGKSDGCAIFHGGYAVSRCDYGERCAFRCTCRRRRRDTFVIRCDPKFLKSRIRVKRKYKGGKIIDEYGETLCSC